MSPKRLWMILSINSSASKYLITLFTVLIILWGCGTVNDPVRSVTSDSPVHRPLRVAFLPVDNLSGGPAPLKHIRDSLSDGFKKQGITPVDEAALEKFIAGHRVRYVGGMNRATAQAFRTEISAEAVLITSLELYSESAPPRIAFTCRLVSTADDTAILWMDGIGLAGDDSLGILGLSLIEDPQSLLDEAVRYLALSLSAHLGDGGTMATPKRRDKFQPKFFYRSPVMATDRRYRVAVMPFFNVSERKYAGEIMALHFVKELRPLENFAVVEPGVVRDTLLALRVIMDDGLSLAYADLIFGRLNADLILTGNVLDYEDYRGPAGKPKVGFSAMLLEKKSREVVWTCQNYNEGDNGVFFFDLGKVNTANAMASEMVRLAVETMAREGGR